MRDLSELPNVLVERLNHYFMTYKLAPGKPSTVKIGAPYGHEHAEKVIEASMEDYQEAFPAGDRRKG